MCLQVLRLPVNRTPTRAALRRLARATSCSALLPRYAVELPGCGSQCTNVSPILRYLIPLRFTLRQAKQQAANKVNAVLVETEESDETASTATEAGIATPAEEISAASDTSEAAAISPSLSEATTVEAENDTPSAEAEPPKMKRTRSTRSSTRLPRKASSIATVSPLAEVN